MITTKIKKIKKTEEVIDKITCDRCQKDLGNTLYDFPGAYFIPSINWCSKMDATEYETTTIVMCDRCWCDFYTTFITDPLRAREDEKNRKDLEWLNAVEKEVKESKENGE